jgi:hypothetical protein
VVEKERLVAHNSEGKGNYNQKELLEEEIGYL